MIKLLSRPSFAMFQPWGNIAIHRSLEVFAVLVAPKLGKHPTTVVKLWNYYDVIQNLWSYQEAETKYYTVVRHTES